MPTAGVGPMNAIEHALLAVIAANGDSTAARAHITRAQRASSDDRPA